MISNIALQMQGRKLEIRSGKQPRAVFDSRTDADDLDCNDTAQLRLHVKHQTLMRSYQGRYTLLPTSMEAGQAGESVVDLLRRHYDPVAMRDLDALRLDLEKELIEPLRAEAASRMADVNAADYVSELLPAIRSTPPSALLLFMASSPHREHYYRHFLIQSSADLLAEASASALGLIGEFGEPQSALFRILIDEFGYGEHSKKHSVLFRNTLRGFGLDTEYNAYWPLFDTPALMVHNVIHYMFQSPRHFFKQVGFLLYAETSYQHSTGEHLRYLRRFHPGIDATYFGEHAHIDIHHTEMIVEEVVKPLIGKYGAQAAHEILTGAEMTRAVFAAADTHMLALCHAFETEAAQGRAIHGLPTSDYTETRCVTPDSLQLCDRPMQVGGMGQINEACRIHSFPDGAVARQGG